MKSCGVSEVNQLYLSSGDKYQSKWTIISLNKKKPNNNLTNEQLIPVKGGSNREYSSLYIIQLFPEGEVNSGGYIPRREASRYISTALHRPCFRQTFYSTFKLVRTTFTSFSFNSDKRKARKNNNSHAAFSLFLEPFCGKLLY